MSRESVLRKTVGMARTGDAGSFEDFYILTAEQTWEKISLLKLSLRESEALFVDTYAAAYQGIHTMPYEEAEISARMEEEIRRIAAGSLKEFHGGGEALEAFRKPDPSRLADLWLEVERKAGFNREEPDERAGFREILLVLVRIVLAFAVFGLTCFVIIAGWSRLRREQNVIRPAETAISQTAAETRAAGKIEISQGAEKQPPGWQVNEEGDLAYVTSDGIYASGYVNIGKQVLEFGEQGILLGIEENPACADRNISFDESVQYEVRNGDVYRKESGGDTACVVRNGHVIKADVRCGYLWYICEYKIPNSSRIKTTFYRALPDGNGSAELYSTNKQIDTTDFQFTSEWMYTKKNGRLLRTSLRDGSREYMTDSVDSYFAWEDTAFCMKGRELEMASEGTPYTGGGADFEVVLADGGFQMINEFGENVTESADMVKEDGTLEDGDRVYRLENGFIADVEPAAREYGGITYFLEDRGEGRKICWQDMAGGSGVLPQEGLWTDSLCIGGKWLYYSVVTKQYESTECDSQVYRMNLDTMAQEALGIVFRGRITEMYWFEEAGAAYGEYFPSVADYSNLHGQIAVIRNGSAGLADDSSVRPESSGCDMLELVAVTKNSIFCLYHEGTYDGSWHNLTSVPLEIEY